MYFLSGCLVGWGFHYQMQHCVVTRPEHLKDEVKETQRAQVVILFLNCVNGFEKVAIINDHNGVIDDLL